MCELASYTQFIFRVADLNFHSDDYDWLIIAGATAMYKGKGSINGDGEYEFLLSAIDGDPKDDGEADKFRMKIWDDAGAVVYDNQLGADDYVEAITKLQGGSIVLHKEK